MKRSKPDDGPSRRSANAASSTKVDDEEESSSDDDFGPRPEAESAAPKKKRRVLKFEDVYVKALPCARRYETSYMHRDTVTHVLVSQATDFLITGSADGHVKFWKKMPRGIEFVKHYKAHTGALTGLALSVDGLQLCTASAKDKALKFYDIRSFDMVSMLRLDFEPASVVYVSTRNAIEQKVAVADKASSHIFVCPTVTGGGAKTEGAASTETTSLSKLTVHRQGVSAMAFNRLANVVISADERGVLEYWDPETLKQPTGGAITFKYKTDTDLYDVAKARARPTSIEVSPNGRSFVVSATDYKYRIFNFRTGKLRRVYDESPEVVTNERAAGKLQHLDPIDVGRRTAIEKELKEATDAPPSNAIFDESGNFLLISTMMGVKVVNIVTNAVSAILGSKERACRFLRIALYQGTAKEDSQMLFKLNEQATKLAPDPLLFCTAFKKRRFYFFSRREPDQDDDDERDVLNERPSLDDHIVAVNASGAEQNGLASSAIIRTSKGDIHLQLFADKCPRTVENFATHAKNGYYDNLIFHRVIDGFMIQTGDPLGDGTGGESIWGGEFEDEIHRSLRHDRPFTLSMANAGPNTNGSQFFITTVPTPWLDNKHTVFGRVTRGMDVVTAIEKVKVNSRDRPLEAVRMLNIDAS